MKELGCGGGFRKEPREKQMFERLIQTAVPGISEEAVVG